MSAGGYDVVVDVDDEVKKHQSLSYTMRELIDVYETG